MAFIPALTPGMDKLQTCYEQSADSNMHLVVCQPWPEAKAKPSQAPARPSQAKPKLWPELAFGLA